MLNAGLVKKSKVAAVAREQNNARHGKAPAAPDEIQLEAERKAQAHAAELPAQARQIINDRKGPRTGES